MARQFTKAVKFLSTFEVFVNSRGLSWTYLSTYSSYIILYIILTQHYGRTDDITGIIAYFLSDWKCTRNTILWF